MNEQKPLPVEKINITSETHKAAICISLDMDGNFDISMWGDGKNLTLVIQEAFKVPDIKKFFYDAVTDHAMKEALKPDNLKKNAKGNN